MPSPRRRGLTALELLFASVLSLVVFGVTMAMMHTGTKGVVSVTDHAQAREEAIRILDRIERDLDRIVVGDAYDRTTFPNVVEPVLLDDRPQASKFMFYALHHREFRQAERRMNLIGQVIEYKVIARDGGGVDLLRNDERVNRDPLEDVRVELIDPDEAGQLGISPFHAFHVVIYPRGAWDARNEGLKTRNPQRRLFHLRGIESQYACLLSLKRAGAPYPILALLPDPPPRSQLYQQYSLDRVPMDWMRPTGLITLDPEFFDEETVGQNLELP